MTLAWLFGFSPITGQAASNKPAQADTPRPAQGLLYRISDGRHSLLLLGTIHVGQPSFYPLDARISQALEQAPVLALELDPGNATAMQAAVKKYGLMADNQRYDTQLDATLATRTRAAIAQAGLPPQAVINFRPWLLAVALTMQAYETAGYQSALAVDNQLAERIRARGKPVLELESANAQLGLMAALAPADEARFLADTLDDLDDADSQRKIADLVSAWQTSDQQALEKSLDEMRREDSFTDRFTLHTLLDARNPGLADGIGSLLQRYDQAVAAIGVLHLVGPTSVPALLRQRGLTVERIY